MERLYFKQLVGNAEAFQKEVDRWVDFGIDLFENPIANTYWELFDVVIEKELDEAGVDWVYWWLFEDHRNGTVTEDDKVIPSETLDNLYDIIFDNSSND